MYSDSSAHMQSAANPLLSSFYLAVLHITQSRGVSVCLRLHYGLIASLMLMCMSAGFVFYLTITTPSPPFPPLPAFETHSRASGSVQSGAVEPPPPPLPVPLIPSTPFTLSFEVDIGMPPDGPKPFCSFTTIAKCSFTESPF